MGNSKWLGAVASMVVFWAHATLLSLLIIAAACDLNGRVIPLSVTLFGAGVGLISATLFPWPWPNDVNTAGIVPNPGVDWCLVMPGRGLYPWPVWGPLPDWLPPGSHRLGFATGLAGILVGTWMLRGVRTLFTRGLGQEALGLGDADLMMMAGAFLGWQPIVVAFFVGVLVALGFAIAQSRSSTKTTAAVRPRIGRGHSDHLALLALDRRHRSRCCCSTRRCCSSAVGAGFWIHVYFECRARPRPAAKGRRIGMNETVIVDYGMANLRSVQKAFERVGAAPRSLAIRSHGRGASKMVLPGVGAFRDAIARLREAGSGAADHGSHRGRQAVPGHLSRPANAVHAQLSRTAYSGARTCSPAKWCDSGDVPGLKVPHMGWNQLRLRRPDCPLLRDVAGWVGTFTSSIRIIARPADDRIVAAEADYPDAIRCTHLAGKRLRHAVSPGKEPARRPDHAAQFRRPIVPFAPLAFHIASVHNWTKVRVGTRECSCKFTPPSTSAAAAASAFAKATSPRKQSSATTRSPSPGAGSSRGLGSCTSLTWTGPNKAGPSMAPVIRASS